MKKIHSTEDFNSRVKQILITEEEIKAAVEEAGKKISALYDGRPILLVSVLKGAFVFMADLCRAVSIPCEIGFMAAKSYYSGTTSTGRTEIRKDVSVDIKDRHVVILEDIYDTGTSLTFTVNHLLNKQPASLKVCTFLDKPERRRPGITLVPEYVGYTIPNEFVVGYGLDYNEHYRNLPYIGILKPEIYEK